MFTPRTALFHSPQNRREETVGVVVVGPQPQIDAVAQRLGPGLAEDLLERHGRRSRGVRPGSVPPPVRSRRTARCRWRRSGARPPPPAGRSRPAATAAAAGSRSRSFAVSRQRASGLRRKVPRPEQGASTSTRSQPPARASGGSGLPGWISRATTFDSPARRARRRSSSSLRPDVSSASSRPPPPSCAASASVLPPAPAQASATRPRGGGATASATSWLPSSITSNSPSWNEGSPKALTRVSKISPTGDSGARLASTPSLAQPLHQRLALRSSRCSPAPPAAPAGSGHRPGPAPRPRPRSLANRSSSQVGKRPPQGLAVEAAWCCPAPPRRPPGAPGDTGARNSSPASSAIGRRIAALPGLVGQQQQLVQRRHRQGLALAARALHQIVDDGLQPPVPANQAVHRLGDAPALPAAQLSVGAERASDDVARVGPFRTCLGGDLQRQRARPPAQARAGAASVDGGLGGSDGGAGVAIGRGMLL